jgi:hypothetical protein
MIEANIALLGFAEDFLSPNNHPTSPFKVGLAGVFPVHLLLFIGFLHLGFPK